VTPRAPALPAGRLGRIRARLRETYGPVLLAPHGRPLDELVLTLLSQSTSDSNRDVAFGRLRTRFGSWAAVRDAPLPEVEAAIRPGGISKVKSARLHAILCELGDPPSLDHLADLPVKEARAALVALPGVGRKTAACVLLFSFGMRDVPVDTHVGRVGARLGLLPARGTPDALHDAMLALTPRGAELELHVNMLRHGRRLCHARSPECPVCPLRRMCPSAVLARRFLPDDPAAD
jgi:endonuclease-3